MLSKKKRKEYLKAVGCADVKSFQKKYMRAKDVDGKYGTNTDKALQSVYNVLTYGDGYFKPEEFRCKCGGKYCTGYPAIIDVQLIKNLAYLRKDSGKPITISSGLRCKKWNAKQSGSASKSRHMSGKAADIISSVLTNTKDARNKLIKRWYSFKKANYAYGNTSNMGKAVHVDVK